MQTRNRASSRRVLLAALCATTLALGACSGKHSSPAEKEGVQDAAGTIVAAKRVVNTEAVRDSASTETISAPLSDNAGPAAEPAASGTTVQAADAAAAASGGKRNGDRQLDHNKW